MPCKSTTGLRRTLGYTRPTSLPSPMSARNSLPARYTNLYRFPTLSPSVCQAGWRIFVNRSYWILQLFQAPQDSHSLRVFKIFGWHVHCFKYFPSYNSPSPSLISELCWRLEIRTGFQLVPTVLEHVGNLQHMLQENTKNGCPCQKLTGENPRITGSWLGTHFPFWV